MKIKIRWIKVSLLSLLGFIVVFVAALAVLFSTFDDEDYRKALIEVVQRVSGDTLAIEGPFHVAFSMTPSISAEGVRLQSANGNYDLDMGKFQVQIALKPLLDDILLVQNLVLQDATLNVSSVTDTNNTTSAKKRRQKKLIPLVPILTQAQLDNITLNYKKTEQEMETITLAELKVMRDKDKQAIVVTGKGSIEGVSYQVKGQAGLLADIVAQKKPYPIDLTFSHPEFRLSVDGTVDDITRMKGMQLQLSGQSSDITSFLKKFHQGTPKLGRFTGEALLYGDIYKPGLDNLKLSIDRGKSLSFKVNGKVENVLTRRGVDLQISGVTRDQNFLSWLLPNEFPELNHGEVSATLHELKSKLMIENIDVQASNQHGLRVELKGETGINDFNAKQVFTNMDVAFHFSSPTTRAAEYFIYDGIPEMGAVKGTARITSPGKDLAIEDVDVTVGSFPSLGMTMKGRTGRVPLSPDIPSSEMDFAVVVQSDSTAAIGTLFFNTSVPEMGPITINEHFQGSNLKSTSEISFRAGGGDYPNMEASGMVTLFEKKGEMTIEKVNAKLQILTAGKADSVKTAEVLTLILKGDQQKTDDISLSTELSIPSVQRLEVVLDRSLPSLAPIRAQGQLTGTAESAVFDGNITVGKTDVIIKLSGNFDLEKPSVKGAVTVPKLYLADIGIHSEQEKPVTKKVTSPKIKQKDDTPNKAKSKKNGPVFSKDPLTFNVLKDKDISLELKINEVDEHEGSIFDIDSIETQLSLQEDVLRIGPGRFVFEGGELHIESEINAQKVPKIKLKMTADNIELVRILSQLDQSRTKGGTLDLYVDLSSQGRSESELAANLNGDFGFAIEDAYVLRKDLDLLSLDALGWVMNSTLKREKYAQLNCVIFRVNAKEGMVKSDVFFVDGPAITVGGKVELNLRDETIDMELFPKKKTKLWGNLRPVEINGPLNDPTVSSISSETLALEGGALVLAPFVYLPARGLGYLGSMLKGKKGEDSRCLQYSDEPDEGSPSSK